VKKRPLSSLSPLPDISSVLTWALILSKGTPGVKPEKCCFGID